MKSLVLNPALKIAAAYVILASVWAVLTNTILRDQLGPHGSLIADLIKTGVWIIVSGVLIFLLVGGPLRQLKSALKDQTTVRKQFERAQRVAKVGSWEIDFSTNSLTWSDETYRIHEVTRENFATNEQSFVDFVPPEDREAFKSARDEWLYNGATAAFEYRIITPSGKTKLLVEHAEVAFNPDGSPDYAMGTVKDVTDQRQKEVEALIWNRRLEAAIEAASIGIWEYTPSENSLYWDSRTFEIYGVSKIDFRSGFSDWRDRVHPDDVEGVERAVSDVLKGRTPSFSIRFRATRPSDGNLIHILAYGKLMRSDEAGGKDVLTGANMNITDWVSAQEQLIHVQKLDSVGQLTGGIAHDFNNLLTVVTSCLDSIGEIAAENEKIGWYVADGQKAAQNAAMLTARLLAFSRKQTLDPKPTDLNELLVGIEPLLRRTLPATMSLQFRHPEDLRLCDVDRGQAENAILNLAINARDAMPEGGALIIETANVVLDEDDCRNEEDVQPGIYSMIAVTDTGTGMSKEHLGRAFEPFFTTKEVGKGSGMGLSMVYGFARQSNGHVRICSEIGVGTTVKLYFPRSLSEAINISRPSLKKGPIVQGSESVLLVEDDPNVQRQVQRQLKRLGYRVTVASDGKEALALLDEMDGFDLLLSDVVLPGGCNGPQIAQAALDQIPGLKVLFISGYSEEAISHSGRLDSGINLLPKPFRNAELAQKLREVLEA